VSFMVWSAVNKACAILGNTGLMLKSRNHKCERRAPLLWTIAKHFIATSLIATPLHRRAVKQHREANSMIRPLRPMA
jgi:hypothetical protein